MLEALVVVMLFGATIVASAALGIALAMGLMTLVARLLDRRDARRSL